jgi:methyl-accepting chemotaxis protein
MKDIKVSVKLLVGFGVPVLFVLVIGVVSIFSLNSLNKDYKETLDIHGVSLAEGGYILMAVHSLRADTRACIVFTGNKDKIRELKSSMELSFNRFERAVAPYSKTIVRAEAREWFDDALEKYEKVFKPSVRKFADEAERGVPAAELVAEMVNVMIPAEDLIANNMRKCVELKHDMVVSAEKRENTRSVNITVVMIVIIFVCVAASVFLGMYISKLISKPLNDTVKMIKEMGKGHLKMRLNLNRDDEIGVMAKTMDKFASDLQNEILTNLKMIAVGDLSSPVTQMDGEDEIGGTLENMVITLKAVVDVIKKISVGDLSAKIESKGDKDEISDALNKTIDTLHRLIVDDGGMVLQAAANRDLSQRLTREYTGDFAKMKDNINKVMQHLDDAMSQVGTAVAQVANVSTEISSGAQSLAEGSSEQASSLEEVSASLEEISSMTKQNADNSNQAKILAAEARVAASDGDATVRRMAAAINQIKLMSDNTVKIIKTIDDIAFQTNLLALNAAVEAARAGEAGKGFAVVAEEVRNLAILSAEAANNTAKMIDESVKNADGGVKITEEVAKSLGLIVDRTTKVNDLIGEIAAASSEQSQGIEQVNIAVAQMSQVTQRNAAGSEESAGSALELSDQAANLASMVRTFKLSKGVGSNSGHHSASGSDSVSAPYQGPEVRRGGSLPSLAAAKPAAALPNRRGGGSSASASPAPAAELSGPAGADAEHHSGGRRGLPSLPPPGVKSARAIKPEEIIPLDDDDLGVF